MPIADQLQDYTFAVGEVLREVREDADLSRRDVERISSGRIKPTTLDQWERGDRNISLDRLCDLARLYQVPVGCC